MHLRLTVKMYLLLLFAEISTTIVILGLSEIKGFQIIFPKSFILPKLIKSSKYGRNCSSGNPTGFPFSIVQESCEYILCTIPPSSAFLFKFSSWFSTFMLFFRSWHGQVICQSTLNFHWMLLPLWVFLAIVGKCFQMTYNQMSSMVNTDIISLFQMPKVPYFPHPCFGQINFDIPRKQLACWISKVIPWGAGIHKAFYSQGFLKIEE